MMRFLTLSLLGLTLPAISQVKPITTIRPKPLITAGDTITVMASPSTVTFALVSKGAAAGSTPVVITTSYSGVNLLGSMTLYGFFASATSALSGGIPLAKIPTSDVFGMVPTGTPTSFTAFTQTTPYGGAGAGLQLFTFNSFLSLFGSRMDSLSLKIDLTSIPQLPAATYSGMLMLEIQAF